MPTPGLELREKVAADRKTFHMEKLEAGWYTRWSAEWFFPALGVLKAEQKARCEFQKRTAPSRNCCLESCVEVSVQLVQPLCLGVQWLNSDSESAGGQFSVCTLSFRSFPEQEDARPFPIIHLCLLSFITRVPPTQYCLGV